MNKEDGNTRQEEVYKHKKGISKERITNYYKRSKYRSLESYYPQDFYYIVNEGLYSEMTQAFRESLEVILRRNIELIDREYIYSNHLKGTELGIRERNLVVADVDGKSWTYIKEECVHMDLHKFTQKGITGLILFMIDVLEEGRSEWLSEDSYWREDIEGGHLRAIIWNKDYYKEDYVYRFERYLITLYRFLGEGIQPVLRDKVRHVGEQLKVLKNKRKEYEGKEEEYLVYKSMLEWEIGVYETFNDWSKREPIYEDRKITAYLRDVNVKVGV